MIFRRVLVTFLCALLAVALAYGVLTWRELRRARDQAQEARSRLAAANAALGDAQSQMDAVRGELDTQFDEIDRLTDEYDARVAALEGEIAALNERLASQPMPVSPGATPAPTPFVGAVLGLRFTPPPGLTALEMDGVVYLGGDALSGMVRAFAGDDGRPLDPDDASPDDLTDRVIDALGLAEGDRPTPQKVEVAGGEGRRFQATYPGKDGEVFGEICVLRGAAAAYLIELEAAPDARDKAAAAMDALLAGLTLPPKP
ncbi:MAG: hypothetical protein GX558_02705 [Clostridiales bacterium]|nr:hypothetical protein [Clostridiales bacterium]